MKQIGILLFLLFACLMYTNSRQARPPVSSSSAGAPRPATLSLVDLVPASALLAVEVSDLSGRWEEIRSCRALGSFQDWLLACAGLSADLVPGLVGDRAVLFLLRSDAPSFVLPIAILEPPDVPQAEAVLSHIRGLSYRHASGRLWLAPAAAENLLERLTQDGVERLADVLPMMEIGERLPAGGLIRGWINPRGLTALMRDVADSAPSTLRWVAAIMAAQLTAMRYAAFRREYAAGELTTDAVIAFDPTRLPPEVAKIANSSGLPVTLPPDSALVLPGGRRPLAVAAFRPEPGAWLPYLKWLAANDPRGPLHNLGFWLAEFEDRYRRDLQAELVGALGDRAWLLAINTETGDSVDVVLVFELRRGGAVEDTLTNLLNWIGEQVWLGSFGAVLPIPWQERQRGRDARGLKLRTLLSEIPGPAFETLGDYLVISSNAEALPLARAWADTVEHLETASEGERLPVPAHGSIVVQGRELARLLQGPGPMSSDLCIWNALLGLLAEVEDLRIDVRHEHDAIHVAGRLKFDDDPDFRYPSPF